MMLQGEQLLFMTMLWELRIKIFLNDSPGISHVDRGQESFFVWLWSSTFCYGIFWNYGSLMRTLRWCLISNWRAIKIRGQCMTSPMKRLKITTIRLSKVLFQAYVMRLNSTISFLSNRKKCIFFLLSFVVEKVQKRFCKWKQGTLPQWCKLTLIEYFLKEYTKIY